MEKLPLSDNAETASKAPRKARKTDPTSPRAKDFEFLGDRVKPGQRKVFSLPAGTLYTGASADIPVEIVHGHHAGPTLLVCAAIHGDELNGVEVVRRVLTANWLKNLRGTLIAVPIVNVLGCLNRSRYLPDRRDLNRCFPGSETGSLAARVAYLFRESVLKRVDYAIDLHTGAIDRSNLPQIRVNLKNEKATQMARWFGVPIIVDSPSGDGTFRGTGDELGIPIITYEAGEALRFDEASILAGIRGVRRIMESLGLIAERTRRRRVHHVIAQSSAWTRAHRGGFLNTILPLGTRIHQGDPLGYIVGPLDKQRDPIIAPFSGIIIGKSNLPVVYEGEALFHIARFDAVEAAEQAVESFQTHLEEQIATQLPNRS